MINNYVIDCVMNIRHIPFYPSDPFSGRDIHWAFI